MEIPPGSASASSRAASIRSSLPQKSIELVELFGLGCCSRGSMAGRICIPIHDGHSELVAYSGRWPGDELPEGKERYKLPANPEKPGVVMR
jgi:hypothetical protein